MTYVTHPIWIRGCVLFEIADIVIYMTSSTDTNTLTGIPLIGYSLTVKTIRKAVKFDTTCHKCGTTVHAGTGQLVKLGTFNRRNCKGHDMWSAVHAAGECSDTPDNNTVAFRTEDDTPHYVPVFRSGAANKRAGRCGHCGVSVEAGEGVLGKGPDGQFFTRHIGDC